MPDLDQLAEETIAQLQAHPEKASCIIQAALNEAAVRARDECAEVAGIRCEEWATRCKLAEDQGIVREMEEARYRSLEAAEIQIQILGCA